MNEEEDEEVNQVKANAEHEDEEEQVIMIETD